jgi:hypothetical protein
VRFSGRHGCGAAFFISSAFCAFATSSSCARSAFDFAGRRDLALVFLAVLFAGGVRLALRAPAFRFAVFLFAGVLALVLDFRVAFFAVRFGAFRDLVDAFRPLRRALDARAMVALPEVCRCDCSFAKSLRRESVPLTGSFLSRNRRRGQAVFSLVGQGAIPMNNNGLALIVGALVVVVAAMLYFGTGMFRGGGGESDINVTIETPAAPPAPSN